MVEKFAMPLEPGAIPMGWGTTFSDPAVVGDDPLLETSQVLVNNYTQDDDLLGHWGTTPTIGREIIFIDAAIVDGQSLIADINPSAEIIRLAAERDGIEQITEVLSQRQNTTAVHIVSHGSAGSLQLGSANLNQETLEQYQSALQEWASALTAEANILFYGCNVAEGEVGQAFVQQLSTLTKADVAASDDLNGNAALGGNWQMEYVSGEIEVIALESNSFIEPPITKVTGFLFQRSLPELLQVLQVLRRRLDSLTHRQRAVNKY